MRDALKFFLRTHPVVFGVFATSLAILVLTLFGFLWHLAHVHLGNDTPRDQALESWMRPRYVAMSWRVPPKVLREDILLIGPPPKDREREPMTMEEIAAQKGVTLEQLTEIVRDGAAAFHAGNR